MELLDEFVRFHWSDSFDLRGVVTSTQNAHIDKFLLIQLQILHHPRPIDLGQGLLSVVDVTNHGCGSEDETISVFSANCVHLAFLAHVAALSFSLSRSLDDRDSHKSQHVHYIFSLLLRNVSCPLLLFQSLSQISDVLSLFLLLSGFLFYFPPSQELSILFSWSLSVEDPDGLDSVLDEEQGPIEESKQVSCLVAFCVCQGGQEVGVGGYSLSGDEELVHRHGGVQCKGHAREVLDISLLDCICGVRANQIHQLVNSHWRNSLYYNQINSDIHALRIRMSDS